MNAALAGDSLGCRPHRVTGPAANDLGGIEASVRTQRRVSAIHTFRKARLRAVSPFLFVLWLCAGVGEARSAEDTQITKSESDALWSSADELVDAGLWPGDFPVRNFIRFGSHEDSQRESKGKSEQEGRQALARQQQAHATSLTKRVFTWHCDGVGKKDGMGNGVVRVMAPVMCVVPADAPITVCDASQPPFWVLMKDGRLSEVRIHAEAMDIKRAGGVLYLREGVESQLIIRLDKDSLLLSKGELAEDSRLEVKLLLGKLRLAVPAQVGFFRCDAMEAARGGTDSIRRGFDIGLNGPKGRPNYFVTQELDPIKNKEWANPTADLLGIRVRLATPEAAEPIWEWSAVGH